MPLLRIVGRNLFVIQLDSGFKIAGMTVYVSIRSLISYIKLRLIKQKSHRNK